MTTTIDADSLQVGGSNRETLSGAKTISASDPRLQSLDPGGSSRDVNLPAESDGETFIIGNRASASGEDLTVKDDGGSTLIVLNQDDVGIFTSDGTGWTAVAMAGAVT